VRTFAGVLGPIVIDEKTGANQSAALFKVERKGFTELPACPESSANKTAGAVQPENKGKKATP